MNGFNQSGGRPRRTGAILAAGLLAGLLLLAGTAGAGWFDKDKNEDGQKGIAHRFDHHPMLSFRQGTLQRDVMGGWRLDDCALQLTRGCVVIRDGAPQGALEEGSHALVAGSVIGGTILATHVMVSGPEADTPTNLNSQTTKQPSEADPTVGVLEGGPR